MRVLVTGGGGFIASHLAERLVNDGHEVRVLLKYNSRNFWGWLEKSPVISHLEIIMGDIRDRDIVFKAVKDIDIVFHLAALIGIPYSYISPDAYVDVNIKGTLNVLQAALRYNAKVVHTSTSEVYGSAQYVPIDEKHPINPQSPYAATKAAADQMALSFYMSFDLPVVIVRPFNTFGPRQSARAVIPTIIVQLLMGKEVIELGNIHTARDFNYIDNTVDGFIKVGLADKGYGQVFNIGLGKSYTIKEVVNIIARTLNRDVDIVISERRKRPEKSEVLNLLSNYEKAKEWFGYMPLVSFEEGIRKTVEWFKDSSNLALYKDIYNV